MEMLDQTVKEILETDDYLSANSRETPMSIGDKQCLKVLEIGAKIVNWKYEVPILWKQIDSSLLNNYEIALRKLRSHHQQFLGNPDLFEKYKETTNTYIKQGYARKVTKEKNINTNHGICHIIQFSILRNQERCE